MIRLAIPDLHFPFNDKRGTDKLLDFAQSIQPDGVDIIGDLIDCYPLSRFDKNPARKGNIQEELDLANHFLTELRSVVGRSVPIDYSEGNHEDRLRRVLWGKVPELAPIRGLSIPELLDLKGLDIKWHPAAAPYKIEDLWFSHGYKIRKHAGASARATSDDVEGSVMVGHAHRMGWSPTTCWSGQRNGWEIGHLCDVSKLDYVSTPPNWQKGWAVTTFGKGWHDVSFCREVRIGKRASFVYQGTAI